MDGDEIQKLLREKAKKRGWTPERVYQEYVDGTAPASARSRIRRWTSDAD